MAMRIAAEAVGGRHRTHYFCSCNENGLLLGILAYIQIGTTYYSTSLTVFAAKQMHSSIAVL